ncbi:PQQ-dependent sugar dehydrogenase [Ramlibacter sp.]|uniref:PQQ-dependent sugar dehydrogenase n=1 Tax=Ramlibacter sp. TaxID=1917967 RepID=UPI00261E3A01|nr:PQQ-dependent sugar dehydrogenase [Ramlibacter sp.]MDB5958604.1 putative L-sorbosone dehydrogenase [Ramlibacter sp.]
MSLNRIAAALALACVAAVTLAPVQAQQLKKYDSTRREFWEKPPADWFLGDETETQKGLAPPAGPALPTSMEDLQKNLRNVKLPRGFKIEVYAQGVPSARQMAWGDKGTLFVGSFGAGSVYAIRDNGGTREVKTILKGLKMPTGLAFRDGALYVVDIDRILRYDNAEATLDNMPEGKVVYSDMPAFVAHGWKYLTFDKAGWLYVPFGPPCNVCLAPTSLSQVRRVNPNTGEAEVVAMGVRNSVGGDIDPRTGQYWFTENARDWVSDDMPSDKLNHIAKTGAHYGYPYCHQGDMLDPKYGAGHKCSEFTPPVAKLGAHVAPLGMKFYTGTQFPAEYRNNIFIAEHGSWNRHQYQGARIKRVIADPNGHVARQEIFASGWIDGQRSYTGRPADILLAPDGSMLVADDWAGAIYRISYGR